jgi:hypothetical protein
MARKDLDFTMLQEELEARRSGRRQPQQAVKQAEQQIKAMDKLLEGIDDFDITEEGDETVIIQNAVELPSDEEIARMKHAMAERDRIEKEEWFNGLSLWKKLLFRLGVIKYAGRR